MDALWLHWSAFPGSGFEVSALATPNSSYIDKGGEGTYLPKMLERMVFESVGRRLLLGREGWTEGCSPHEKMMASDKISRGNVAFSLGGNCGSS